MANRRMISKSISTSIKLNRLSSDSVRLLFTWLIPHADDEGRLQGDSLYIKGTVLPMSNCTIKHIEKWLIELHNNQLIQLYKDSKNERYIQILQWFEHQTIQKDRKKTSKIPEPTECIQPVSNSDTDRNPNIREVNIREDNIICTNVSKDTFFECVFLSTDEYKKLTDQFGEEGATARIKNLANYIKSKGRKYKSHYHTILMWESKNTKQEPIKNNNNGNSAWEKVLAAVRSRGEEKEAIKKDAKIMSAFNAMGGFSAAGTWTERDLTFKRSEFLKLYNS